MPLMGVLRGLKKTAPETRVLILGLDGAGKTSLVKRLTAAGDPQQTEPTKGFNNALIKVGDREINAWDVGGQENIRQYWSNYYRSTDLLVC